MEKYEFNVKVDILKKSVKSGDYETALRIADSVDWRRVQCKPTLHRIRSL